MATINHNLPLSFNFHLATRNILHLLALRCSAVCPNMTMEALNGSMCTNTSEIILTEPSTVAFRCMYEAEPPSVTIYKWSIDGVEQVGQNGTMTHIHVPSDTHVVKCEAFIDVTGNLTVGNATENCTCYEMKTITVVVVGM